MICTLKMLEKITCHPGNEVDAQNILFILHLLEVTKPMEAAPLFTGECVYMSEYTPCSYEWLN